MSPALTRPNRNIALFATLVLSPLIVDMSAYLIEILLAILVVCAFILIVGWQFFVARYLGKGKHWQAAIDHYKAFEARASKLRLGKVSLPVFMSIYTYSGVALAKNNMAFCYMNRGDLGEAKRLCHEALEIDPKYAVPHINLGVIAALEEDAEAADDWLQRGFELGYRNHGVQRQVRRIFAGVNIAAGSVTSSRGDGDASG